jgi:DNA-binding MarR family transcriptional regulator
MTSTPECTPKVVEILSVLVDSGGEALGSHLAMTCALTKPQLTRQLKWMERQDLINHVDGGNGRIWVRATVRGRAALGRPAAVQDRRLD